MTDDALRVELHGHEVGELRSDGQRVRFHASAEALDRHGFGATVLSTALPLDSARASAAATEAFFGGLLPEGSRLTALLAARPDLSRGDLIGLLRAIGGDVAGSLVLPGPAVTSLGRLLTDEEAALEVASPTAFLAGGGSAASGVQPKVAFGRSAQGWHAASGGHPSTHLVKPSSADALRDAEAEVWVMRLAREVGLVDHEVALQWFGAVPAVVVERFDRVVTGERVERVHQEDGAQALGLAWGGDDKFEWAGAGASYRAIAALLDRDRTVVASGPSDQELLLRQMVFRMLVGDTDGHAKNHALVHREPDRVSLAPLYDVTPVALFGGGAGPALLVGGRRLLIDVDIDAVADEGSSWGLARGDVRRVALALAERVLDAARALGAPDSVAAHLPGYVTRAASALLAGGVVGLALGEFPTVAPIQPV